MNLSKEQENKSTTDKAVYVFLWLRIFFATIIYGVLVFAGTLLLAETIWGKIAGGGFLAITILLGIYFAESARKKGTLEKHSLKNTDDLDELAKEMREKESKD